VVGKVVENPVTNLSEDESGSDRHGEKIEEFILKFNE
jgi:hypothetical protein